MLDAKGNAILSRWRVSKMGRDEESATMACGQDPGDIVGRGTCWEQIDLSGSVANKLSGLGRRWKEVFPTYPAPDRLIPFLSFPVFPILDMPTRMGKGHDAG